MIVIDASVAVAAMTGDGDSRQHLAREAVGVPHLVDSEVANALRNMVRRGALDGETAGELLDRWARLGIERFGATGLLPRIWELRPNVTAYDATYVALAEALGCSLVTADVRLARANGPTCPIIVVKT